MTGISYRRSAVAVWRSTPWYLAVGVPGAAPIEVSGSASLVWDRLAEPVTVEDLSVALAGVTGESAGQIMGDLVPLLQTLVAAGVAEVV